MFNFNNLFMDLLKLQIEVSLSPNTLEVLTSLLSFMGSNKPVPTQATTAAAKPVAQTLPSGVPTPAPAEEAPKASSPAAPAHSIDDLRRVLAAKVNNHREAIKAKLSELGAANVTKLDPSKYDELFEFIDALD